ncbi:MAG TPA: hypothetical protein VFG68_23780 [Fimbriiglobus sp.]|nr:hypothetical protein [Fimbriiglobus sp.]
MTDDGPQPLDAAIASSLRRASTAGPRPMDTACRLPGRKEPVRLARPHHPRTWPGIDPKLRACLKTLVDGRSPWPLYLWSASPGTGKTSAALAILDHCAPVRSDWSCSEELRDLMAGFCDFAILPGVLRAAEKPRFYWQEPGRGGTVYASDLWRWLKSARIIVLDDVRLPSAREQALGEDHYGVFKRVLDERIGRPLVVTTNICPWETASGEMTELVRLFDDRIADRAVSGTVVELAGDSRRWRR